MKDCVYKTCNKCNESKQIGDFFFRKDSFGYRRECKVCFNHKLDNNEYFIRKEKRRLELLEVTNLLGLRLRKCNRCFCINTLDKFRPDFHADNKIFAICYNCLNKDRKNAYFLNSRKILDKQLQWNKDNPEKLKLIRQKTYIKRKNKISEYCKKKYRENPSYFKNKTKRWYKNNFLAKKQTDKRYYTNNKQRIRKRQSQWHKQRLSCDISYRIKIYLRGFLKDSLKNRGFKKQDKSIEYFGCDIKTLKLYIESLFQEGMTWDNWGKVWQLDHIIPCAAFDLISLEQQKKCFHYTNLQPLWAEENLKKSDYLPDGSRARCKKYCNNM